MIKGKEGGMLLLLCICYLFKLCNMMCYRIAGTIRSGWLLRREECSLLRRNRHKGVGGALWRGKGAGHFFADQGYLGVDCLA
ncbi:hypothetical protein KTH_41130 [Thermosporothrix hazakensis]|nr:hypothetical protein KTH_41130 [Thermosporothrix hazakensis]